MIQGLKLHGCQCSRDGHWQGLGHPRPGHHEPEDQGRVGEVNQTLRDSPRDLQQALDVENNEEVS